MSKSLRLLTTNERPWANHSGRSPKMSHHERFAQVAHQNWANERIAQVAHQTWANEQNARLFERIAQFLIISLKTNDSLRKPMSEFPTLEFISNLSWTRETTCAVVVWVPGILHHTWYHLSVCPPPVGWSDLVLYSNFEDYARLSIRYIFRSSIPKIVKLG